MCNDLDFYILDHRSVSVYNFHSGMLCHIRLSFFNLKNYRHYIFLTRNDLQTRIRNASINGIMMTIMQLNVCSYSQHVFKKGIGQIFV